MDLLRTKENKIKYLLEKKKSDGGKSDGLFKSNKPAE